MLNLTHTNKTEAGKNGDKDGKTLYKLMKMLYMEKQWKISEIELM